MKGGKVDFHSYSAKRMLREDTGASACARGIRFDREKQNDVDNTVKKDRSNEREFSVAAR